MNTQIENQTSMPPVLARQQVKKKKAPHPGKHKMSAEKRRQIMSTRVLPSTLIYLNGLSCGTPGRAVDLLVKAMRDGLVQDLLKRGQEFEIVKIPS